MSSTPPPLNASSTLPIRFTGSGSEYFRIWIVNLLLTLVTLGLYFPWAKVRRLRYFYGNTLVGEHALDFHGDPKKMLRGFLLVGLLLVLYSVAGQVSPAAGLLALVVVALVWPALMRASLQFRLANTSWRGLRFHFTDDLAGAYMALLPLFVPGILMLGILLFIPEGDEPQPVAAGLVGVAALVSFALVPLLLYRLKRYQHDHYALGPWRTTFVAGPGSFYTLFAKASGVMLLAGLVVGGLALIGGIVVGLLMSAAGAHFGGAGGQPNPLSFLIGVAIGITFYVVLFAVYGPYYTVRMQNLVWGQTRGREVGFESDLRFWSLFWLTLKNIALCLLTLGLYWPFAKVAFTRARLEAVSVFTHHPIDDLIGTQARAADATGDAAGDLFGIDIGL